MTHHLDIFMFGKNLGLNGLILLVNEYLKVGYNAVSCIQSCLHW